MAREIDNFYPECFIYHNVRLWDEESARLLPHWKETHRFVEAARWGPPCPSFKRPQALFLPCSASSGTMSAPSLLSPLRWGLSAHCGAL